MELPSTEELWATGLGIVPLQNRRYSPDIWHGFVSFVHLLIYGRSVLLADGLAGRGGTPLIYYIID
jgi:hypothetical protein